METLDFVFNKAMQLANRYRGLELGIYRKMVQGIPIPTKDMQLSEWNGLAQRSMQDFLKGIKDMPVSFAKDFKRNLNNDFKSVIKDTTTLVDNQLKAIKRKVPKFIPPSNPTDKLLFIQSMNDKSLSLLNAINEGTLNADSRILRQFDNHFSNTINNVIVKVNNGLPLKKATSQVIRKLADNNLMTVTYSNGRKVSMKHYVEMNVRTNLTKAHLETQKDRMKDYGLDLVQISEHSDCSLLCLPYQGQVFSLSGGNERYQSIDTATAGGLYHINCRHMQFPYVEGASNAPKISSKEIKEQRELRKQFKENENKIFKSQKRITARKFLSKKVVNNSRISMSESISANEEILSNENILTATVERKMPRSAFKKYTFITEEDYYSGNILRTSIEPIKLKGVDQIDISALQETALRTYIGPKQFKKINKVARNYKLINKNIKNINKLKSINKTISNLSKKEIEFAMRNIELLDDVFKSKLSLSENVKVFRGVKYDVKSIPSEFKKLFNLKKGDVMKFKGYTSTSLDEKAISAFQTDIKNKSLNKISMEIYAPKSSKAVYIEDISTYNEHEVLFDRGTTFKLIKKQELEKGHKKFIMEVINE